MIWFCLCLFVPIKTNSIEDKIRTKKVAWWLLRNVRCLDHLFGRYGVSATTSIRRKTRVNAQPLYNQMLLPSSEFNQKEDKVGAKQATFSEYTVSRRFGVARCLCRGYQANHLDALLTPCWGGWEQRKLSYGGVAIRGERAIEGQLCSSGVGRFMTYGNQTIHHNFLNFGIGSIIFLGTSSV